jgi:deferrochelatase/peroxidase EfeB
VAKPNVCAAGIATGATRLVIVSADHPIEPRQDTASSGELTVQPAVPSRRAFLAGAGATAVAGLAAACSGSDLAEGAIGQPTTIPAAPMPLIQPPATRSASNESTVAASPLVFAGEHQAGVMQPPQPAGLVASFNVITTDRGELIETLQVLSAEIERIMSDRPVAAVDEFLAPADSGVVDANSGTAGVSITLAVGASLFDNRFDLSDQRPRELIPMPNFFNDRLVRDELSHGDLSLTITAADRQAVAFALHQAVRVTERRFLLRWVQEGYNQQLPEQPGQIAHSRNLLGFRDGTSNLESADDRQMSDFVWVQPGDGEPDWAVGGTYQAARIIRMLIEFWATAALVRQEQIFGRHRDTGAPLGQEAEGDEPAFAADPNDDTIPRRSHMRLANPRTPGTGRILRRGFSYLNGAAADGTLDQGLLFLCYQRSLSRGFFEVQSRLDGEPLEDYVKPVGGGLFFVLPGPAEQDGWLGESLFAS